MEIGVEIKNSEQSWHRPLPERTERKMRKQRMEETKIKKGEDGNRENSDRWRAELPQMTRWTQKLAWMAQGGKMVEKVGGKKVEILVVKK